MLTRSGFHFNNINRILIRSTNWVGDAILTTPALRAVRKNFPDAEISLLAKPWVEPVFYHNTSVDFLLRYDDKGRHSGWPGKVRLAKELRKGKYDLAILFQNAFEAALITFLAGIPNRLGFNTDGRHFLLTHPVRLASGFRQVHETAYYLGILEGAGFATDGRGLTLVVSEKERTWALETLREYVRNGSKPIVGVSPGATFGSAKRWSPERYASLCDRIYEFSQAHILIFGGSRERAIGNEMARLMKYPSTNFCGATDLRQAMALIERCQLFLTNDSGLMHVAAALNIPLIAVFGSTNPITTGPSGSMSHIVCFPVSCSPCLEPECPTDHRCMKGVTVDMVYRLAEELLAKTS
jgi:heptosyltransferase-2